MIGGQVAKCDLQFFLFKISHKFLSFARVLESKNPNYKVGDYIFGQLGWRTHTIFNPSTGDYILPPYVLPSFGEYPLSLAIGALGMPG